MHIFTTKPEIITNFPKGYPKYKIILTNFMFNFAGTIAFPRKNLLSKQDIKDMKKNLKRGDILLVGNLRTIFSTFLPAPITHVALVLNKKKIIHSSTHGVEIVPMKEFYTIYDTAIILRTKLNKKNRKKKINKALKYAHQKKGKAYNFYFEDKKDSAFCSAFANECLKHAKINTKLKDFDKDILLFNDYKMKTMKKPDFSAALKPSDFIKGNFKTVFKSHNIKIKNKEIIFLEPNKNIDAFISNFELETNSDWLKKTRNERKRLTAKIVKEIINNKIKE